jgi:hypothetical protein
MSLTVGTREQRQPARTDFRRLLRGFKWFHTLSGRASLELGDLKVSIEQQKIHLIACTAPLSYVMARQWNGTGKN